MWAIFSVLFLRKKLQLDGGQSPYSPHVLLHDTWPQVITCGTLETEMTRVSSDRSAYAAYPSVSLTLEVCTIIMCRLTH